MTHSYDQVQCFSLLSVKCCCLISFDNIETCDIPFVLVDAVQLSETGHGGISIILTCIQATRHCITTTKHGSPHKQNIEFLKKGSTVLY